MNQTVQSRVPIYAESDIVTARQEGRSYAVRLGFSLSDQTLIATAISEVARNIVTYAGRGEILFDLDAQGVMLTIIARDEGPGIEDVSLAMQDGYSTGQGLGLGLPGARRLMDDFEIESSPGQGTVITMRKGKG